MGVAEVEGVEGEEEEGVEGERGGVRFGEGSVQGIEGVLGVVEDRRRDKVHVMALPREREARWWRW